MNKKKKNNHLKEISKKALLGKTEPKQKKTKANSFLKEIITDPLTKYVILGVFTVALALFAFFIKDLPSPKNLTSQENFSVSTQIFDRHGKLLYEIYADENRIPIKIEDLPPHVLQATIAIEDKNFYKHFGFDLEGIARALKNNLTGDKLEGGSTITQQLVKNALLTPEKSLQRKVKEATLSVLTEIIYTKEEILEMYLNYISYGGTAVGIESAAKKYFDKSAKDLTLAEATMLVGLPQAPSLYSPFGSDPERAKNRQAEVLRRMVEEGYISPLEAEDAKAETLQFALKKTDIKAPHFVFYVKDILYEKYGEETVEKGGLRVTTTLDLDLQEAAQASLSAEIDSLQRLKVGNGAAMVTKPNTGEILAMVGSKNYFNSEEDGQVNVAIAYRQPGSSIKPIVYATAFQEKTLNPGTILLDIPTCFKLPNQADYCPNNYTGDFKGPISVRQSLGNSLNIPAVKAISTIDVPTFINQAQKMGITGWNDPSNYGPSIALGGGEVRMIDMAQAFGSLANLGIKVPLTPILKIENYKGETLEEFDREKTKQTLKELQADEFSSRQGDLERVLEAGPAYLVSHIMQDNTARTLAFGSNSQLVIPGQVVSAKTGTTNDLKDNWTIGFTPEFLTVTWVGNNDGSSMSYVASGVTGAAPIFNDIMSYALRDQESLWPEKPESVIKGPICSSGFPPQLDENNCSVIGEDYYWKESQPSLSTKMEKEVWIKPETGLPPEYGEQAEGLVLEKHTLYQDPVTELYCADCNRPVDEQGKVVYEKHYVEQR
ncbi:MAG: transglycosylase domain-containing protein [Patescibacteria group bacterium]